MKFRKIAILAITVFSSLTMAAPSFASEFNFAVTPKPSENQIDKQKTYFDLLLAPNQEETLTVDLRNDTDKEVVVEAQIDRFYFKQLTLGPKHSASNCILDYL